MREGAKTRLTGAVVLVTLAVIFVPMLFEDDNAARIDAPGDLAAPPVSPPPPRARAVERFPPAGGSLDAGDAGTGPPPAWSVESSPPAKPAPPTPPARPVATPPPPRTGPPSWVIQVASLGTPESAAELEGRLRDGGFPAFVEQADVNGRTFYRVRVGPEQERTHAEQIAAKLRARYRVETLIHKYP